jgi:hypothetical protein
MSSAMLRIIISGPWPALRFFFLSPYSSLSVSHFLCQLVLLYQSASLEVKAIDFRPPSKRKNMAANLITQPPIMLSPFRKSSPAWGDDPARNDLFSRRFSSGVLSQENFIATAQVPAPLQADPAKQAQNSKQPVPNTKCREQHNSGNMQPTCTAPDGTTFTHPAELFKASWNFSKSFTINDMPIGLPLNPQARQVM